MNGKKFAWQGVALLPFVDEKRLFKALEPYYNELSSDEIKRNCKGEDRLYVSSRNKGYGFIKGLYVQKVQTDAEAAVSMDGMRGTVLVTDECVTVGG